MKIGIVTQPLSRNYGGILQNYALQQTLIKLGHTPYTFDLGKYTWKDWVISTIKNIIKICIGRPYYFLETPNRRLQSEMFLRSFVERYIKLISSRDCKITPNKINEYNLDVIIVGSDQVWRPKYNYRIEDMYLDFAKDLDIKRIAYAASFGTDEWEYTDEQTVACKFLAQKFDAISVREKSGAGLCKKHFAVNAVHLIDPTLLLTVDEYKKLLVNIPESKSKYMFAYILDQTEEKIKHIKNCADDLGLDIIIKGAGTRLSMDDSIEEWIANIRDAKYIITDSFHGCVFSIIFNKAFIALGNKERGMSRFNSLLELFGLENRLIDPAENLASHICDLDWVEINYKIKIYQEMSLKFLKDNL